MLFRDLWKLNSRLTKKIVSAFFWNINQNLLNKDVYVYVCVCKQEKKSYNQFLNATLNPLAHTEPSCPPKTIDLGRQLYKHMGDLENT